ncbi:hypothetical protein KA977_01580 [Candidatus Dependentiae bacterium]|nr:hypothetical protein [Candidatus Dependentiae bacterium]
MNIIFRADTGIDIGIGDLLSCINLGMTLEKYGHKCVYLVRDSVSSIQLLERYDFEYEIMSLKMSIKQECVFIEEKCKQYSADVLILEITRNSYNEYQFSAKPARVLAAIDFQGSADSRFDLIVNWEINSNLLYNEKKFPSTNFLLGPDKVILSDEICSFRQYNKNVEKPGIESEKLKVLITFGGSDSVDSTSKMLKSLSRISSNLEIKVIIGDANVNLESVKKNVELLNHKIEILPSQKSIVYLLNWCDIIICAGGLTVSEVVALRKSAVVIANCEHQIPRCEYFYKMNLISYLGFCENIDFEKLYDNQKFVRIFNDSEYRNKLSEECAEAFTAFGGNELIRFNIENLGLQADRNNIEKKKSVVILSLNSFPGLISKLVESGFRVICLFVENKSEKRVENVIDELKMKSVEFHFYNKKTAEEFLRGNCQEYDYLLSMGWPYIISEDIVELWEGRAFNVHPAVLPDYPGYSPEWEVISADEYEHGLTFHLLDKKADTGKILFQKRFPVDITYNATDLKESAFRKIPGFVADSMNKLLSLNFDTIEFPFNEIKKYCPPRKPSDSLIDVEKKMIDIVPAIRAADTKAYPAFFYYKNKKVKVKFEYADPDEK